MGVDGLDVEVWVERTDGRAPQTILPSVNGRLASNGNGRPLPEAELFVLKFNGNGGRAERASIHPLDFWSDRPGEVWSHNPPGYGASGGKARDRKSVV